MFQQIYKRSLRLDETILRQLHGLLVGRDLVPSYSLQSFADIDSLSLPEPDLDYPQQTIAQLQKEWTNMKDLLRLCNLDRVHLRNENFQLLSNFVNAEELSVDQFMARAQSIHFELYKTLLERERSKNEQLKLALLNYSTEPTVDPTVEPVTLRGSGDCTPHEEFLASDFLTDTEVGSLGGEPYVSVNGMLPDCVSTMTSPKPLDLCSPVSMQDSSLDEAELSDGEVSHNFPRVHVDFKAKMDNCGPPSPETPAALVSLAFTDSFTGIVVQANML